MINKSICNAMVSTNNLDHKTWIKYRKNGIGGSDAGAILGVNKYATKLDVYLDKTSNNEIEKEENENIYWGNVLEDIVAKEFSKRTGKKIRRKNQILQNKINKFMLANIDRDIIGENALLECKTTSSNLSKLWEDEEAPATYITQCQHYMAVTGAETVYLACLVGGNRFIYKTINRDEEFINMLIKAEKEFWFENVLKLNPPITMGASNSALLELYPQENKELIEDNSIENDLLRLKVLKEEEKEIKNDIQDIESLIKQKIGNNYGIKTDKYIATWSEYNMSQFNKKKFENDYPELYKKYIESKEQRRFNLKEVI